LPDAALVIVKGSVAAVHYQDLEVSNSKTRFIEEETVPADSLLVGQTWRYVNKQGGPDRRFNSNVQLPICLYGEISFRSEGGLNCKSQCSDPAASDRLSNVIEGLHRSNATLPKAITYVQTAKVWPSVAFLVCAITFGAGLLAFFHKELTSLQEKSALSRNASDQRSQATISTQSTVVLPANRQGQGAPWESKTVALPAQISNRAPQAMYQVESTVAKPPAQNVPLPRPRPKF
jgi:hypothetical protein